MWNPNLFSLHVVFNVYNQGDNKSYFPCLANPILNDIVKKKNTSLFWPNLKCLQCITHVQFHQRACSKNHLYNVSVLECQLPRFITTSQGNKEYYLDGSPL